MMRSFPIEVRLRYVLYVVIDALGFYAPWERFTTLPSAQSTTWLTLAAIPAREHWLSFTGASQLVLVLGCCAATAGALLRLWAASYRGAPVLQSPDLHGTRILADGPFRHLRNPSYLGTFLNTLALALLMPPTGAAFAIAATALLQLRLIGAEEASLTTSLGAPYRAYCAAVPRLWPTLRPRVPATGRVPNLLLGLASEIFVIGTAISFLVLGGRYNSLLIIKGVLIALGLSLIARAFLPPGKPATQPA